MTTSDLRPMTLGEVLDRTFTLYRENFLLFAGISALPHLITLFFNFGFLMFQRSAATGSGPNLSSPGLIGSVVVAALVGAFLALLALGLAQAATVSAVSELYLGRPTSVRDSYTQSIGSILIVVGIIIMTGLATGVGLIFLIVPGIYIACRLAISVPVAIVEKESPVAAMERSMELTKDYAGQMFLLLLLVTVLTYVVGILLQFPVLISTFTAAMAKRQPSVGVTAYSYIATYVSQVVVSPIGTISACLMYYNLRVRKEGFDIQHLMNSLGNMPRPLADPTGVR